MAVVNNLGRSLYYAAAGDVQAGRLVVAGFSWTGGTTAAHTMTFKDSAGDIVWGPFLLNATLNDVNIMFPRPVEVNGLEVDVLDSGVVNVFLA
jgi:dienelactone hydrolase